MANIEKQLVAKAPIKDLSNFILNYTDDWGIVVKKIWNKKEVERITFKLSDDEGVFECGPKLAEKISLAIKMAFRSNHIDEDKVKNIEIIIAEDENEPVVGVITENLSKIGTFNNIWKSIKKVFV